MARCVNATQGFTLSDLTTQDGLVFEIGEYQGMDEEEFSYSPAIPLTNEEALNLLNMDDFQDGDDDNDNDDDDTTKDNSVSLFGISFDKLKTKMTDILGNGKIMKLLKQKGVGEIIPSNAQVTIKYMGHFEYNDEPFDSSFTRGGAETFLLGQGSLLPGLEIAISTMQKHEIAIFIVHSDLAYGRFGCAPRIPPNEQILFIVHLIDYLDNGSVKTLENLPIDERKIFANVVRGVSAKFNTAKDYFRRKKIKQAIREYAKAIQWLEEAQLQNDEDEEEFNKLVSRGYSNLAVCYNMENMPRRACNACNRVPMPSAKTHFNHGRALLKMGEYTKAMEQLQMAVAIEPNNEETIKEIRLVNEKQRKYLEIEKQLWANCLKTEQKEKKESSFAKVVRKMCETFSKDSQLLRQPLPESLTPEEDKCIREQAAAFGLSITKHKRYGREITYLNKYNY
ncbi:PREDICTED: inactive peptidyl-prolyl cis-trans isomerase shutdown [Dufourea novaeangliae]|uniref:peptidylprolyl isomerase n=1 Tax=Dufourea novaeangliae TaxID=178035 RepID=A0A154PEE0_DUFNO|nr:PREDICTED: inactive peptidyl-prolyl cis-trans isomerase shutdown [Dufourea novaeangliae]KZC09784.1 Peptidyl-prolyl cis-trans isomerase FKBP6 [Dufourea novaeangliae]